MKDKKHIDELFKDRFSSFEVSPSPEVWSGIQASLEKRKKDRNLIPLWWKLGGVAALLALLLTIGNSVFNNSDADNSIVTNDDAKPSVENNSEKNFILKDLSTNQIDIGSEENATSSEDETTKNNVEVDSEQIVKSEGIVYQNSDKSENSIATSTKSSNISEENDTNTNVKNKKFIDEKVIGVSTEADAIAIQNKINSIKTNKTDIQKEVSKTESLTAVIDVDKSAEKSSNTEITEAENNKQSIQDAINEQNAIKLEVATEKQSSLDDRWDVTPNFAPVYYSTLGGGSSLDPTFSDNAQSGDVNISYGVQVSYALNERLSVRSGISNVDLSYSTSGIELGTAPVSVALKSVNYEGKQTVLTAVDIGTISNQNTSNGAFGNIKPKSTNGAAEIIQNITYYEVPLELKYALVNNKIGVNIIGGLSTLFLGNNDVSVKAGDFGSSLGEANNLSSVSVSTNVGLGVDYKISKKFKFNVEPMFKYQLNPYTDSSVDFQPYYIGIYTGLSFKF